jgi:uncharacterized protein (TIGR02145 family)
LARDEPKPLKRAFIECLEHGIVKILKDVTKEERANCKEALAQRLHTEEGRDVELYRKAIDILCEVLFGSVPSPTVTIVNMPKNPTAALTASQSGNSHFKDPRDGKVYRTVKIGNQVWMAENLNYKIGGSWCYDNDKANGRKYGRLYTWDAAKVACPVGWHLPTRQEWGELLVTVGGFSVAGKKLKATSGWDNNGNSTDDYGFSALPGGYRSSDGGFGNAGNNGNWWTATESNSDDAYNRYVYYSNDNVNEHYFIKSVGFSVRCLRD